MTDTVLVALIGAGVNLVGFTLTGLLNLRSQRVNLINQKGIQDVHTIVNSNTEAQNREIRRLHEALETSNISLAATDASLKRLVKNQEDLIMSMNNHSKDITK